MRLFSKSNVATIAIVTGIVVASGTGGAVAGAMITGKQIKDGTVTSADIANGSLTGSDVKNGSLRRSDLATTARGFGSPSIIKLSTPIQSGSGADLTANCPSGKKIVTGDAWLVGARTAVQVEIVTSTQARAWASIVENSDTLVFRAVCAVY